MSTEYGVVLREVRTLAQERGWTQVQKATDDLLAGQQATLAIAAQAGVETQAFQRWISNTLPGALVTSLPLEELAQDPFPALKAQKVLALFQCGALLGATEAEALAQAFLNRPPDSYAIVLSGTERIASEDELALVERGAWRLFVPDAPLNLEGQALREHGCYLWCEASIAPFLQGRIQQDMVALGEWMHQPVTQTDALEQLRVFHVLRLADEQTAQGEQMQPPTLDRQAQEARRLLHTRESLSSVRRRLLRRVDEDVEALEQQLTTSLQTLEQDLLQSLRPYLQAHLSPSMNEQMLQQLLTAYFTRNIERWKSEAQQVLTNRSEEIAVGNAALLQDIDWALVNEIAARNGGQTTYPAALWQHPFSTDFPFTPESMGSRFDPARQRVTSLQTTIRATVAGALAGSGVLAVTAIFLGFGPLGLIAAGATAVISGIVVKGRMEHGEVLIIIESQARSAVSAAMRDAIASTRERIRQSFKPIREQIATEFHSLETLFDTAIQEARAATHEENSSKNDRQLLDEYRRRIAADVV